MPRIIGVSPTPNENALKFDLDGKLVESGAKTFKSVADAEAYPGVARIMALPGIAQVFTVNDFMTVNKSPEADWDTLEKAVRSAFEG